MVFVEHPYTLTANDSYKVPYRNQRFYVKRKGSIPYNFQEKVFQRNRLRSGFHTEPFA